MGKYEEIVKEWQKKKIECGADLEQALDNFRILFAYHSNAIENPETTYHDTREIFENGKVIGFTGDVRTIFEIQNQKDCYEMLKQHILDKEPVSSELICGMHKVLMKGCYDANRYAKGERPGEYKKQEYVVGDNIGVLQGEVPEEIEYICEAVNEYQGADILTAASYLHLNFESIHPFADGNGRVGRALMNFYLMIHNYPPAIIYYEDKKDYYLALALFDTTEQIDGFKAFIREQTVKTWDRKNHNRGKIETDE